MTLSFRYKRVKRPDGEVKSPSIPVILSGKATKFEFVVLLDSGADISAIPKSVAELLGLDLSGKKEEIEIRLCGLFLLLLPIIFYFVDRLIK